SVPTGCNCDWTVAAATAQRHGRHLDMDASLTRRAYTLRLSGDDSSGWRDALWNTHLAVNRGAMLFGDWLLTMRGGLPHDLAANLPKAQDCLPEEERRAAVRDRRILLALSWLSVEAPHEKAHGPRIEHEPLRALREILERRELPGPEIDQWTLDCRDSLMAAIREDAVW